MSKSRDSDDISSHRERVYEALEDDEDHQSAIADALDVARERLGVDVAVVSNIEDGLWTIEQSVGDGIEPGFTCPLDDAYCERTVERDSPLCVQDAATSPLVDDEKYERFGFSTYIGSRLEVDGETYGVVCFGDPDPRDGPFTEADELFVELVARLVSNRIERRIHERELAEQNVRLESERAHFEDIADTSFDIIYRIDRTGRFSYISAAVERIIGYEPAELVGDRFSDHVTDESIEAAMAVFERLQSGESVQGVDLRFVDADGEAVTLEVNVRPIVEGGEVTAMQGVARDVTARRERERELRLKSRAIEEAAVGITIADARQSDNPTVYVNEAFESLSGYDAAEMRGRNCRILQGEGTDEAAVSTLATGVSESETVEAELLNYRQDGTPFWNRVKIAPVEDEVGTVTHYVGFQDDVTEKVRTQRLVQLLNRILRHNLRNDMNVLLGYADFVEDPAMRERVDLSTGMEELARGLTDLSERARELQTYAGRDREAERLGPAELIEEATASADLDGFAVTVETDVRTVRSLCAGGELREALAELLTNAAKHDPTPTNVAVVVEDDGDELVVSVVDDGPGIQPVEAKAIRAEEETALEHGNGLGLWFVNWIVTRYGGSFSVEADESGVGTVATVRLPAVAADESVASAERRPTTLFR